MLNQNNLTFKKIALYAIGLCAFAAFARHYVHKYQALMADVSNVEPTSAEFSGGVLSRDAESLADIFQSMPELSASSKTTFLAGKAVAKNVGLVQTAAVYANANEAKRWQYSEFVYPDGAVVTLRQPAVRDKAEQDKAGQDRVERDDAFEHDSRGFSLLGLTGAGLLENIADEDILGQEDALDYNADGITGRANKILKVVNNGGAAQWSVGRFGRQAEHATLRAYSESVLAVAADDVDALLHYLSLVGVPKRRDFLRRDVQEGRLYFQGVGCDKCHTPHYTTQENTRYPQLSQQEIWPYTDFLLHDMGEGLAIHAKSPTARHMAEKPTVQEWRTSPLWGAGLPVTGDSREGGNKQPVDNRKARTYLHDRRAQNLEAAVLWHGGEAKISWQGFVNLNKAQREALLAFVGSL